MNRRINGFAPAFGAAVALACAFGLLLSHRAANRANAQAAKITPAAYLEAAAIEMDTPEAQAITVSVDATKSRPANRAALESAVRSAESAMPPLPESYAAARTLGRAGEWFRWGRLADRQAETTVALPSGAKERADAEPIAVYAVTGATGATALLVNTSGRTLTVRCRIRLGRGAYEAQMLRFSPPSPDTAPDAQKPAPAPNDAPTGQTCETRITYLDGCDFGATRAAERMVILRRGESALIRTNNVARIAVGAYYHAAELLTALQSSSPGLARRLRTMLRDGASGLNGLLPSGRRGSNGRVGAIHHLLLLTAQAQALERNYLRRGGVQQAEGAAIAEALEALSRALSQTSAVALNLVPQIEVLPDAGGGARVSVSLRNGGTRSVDSVKLGLDDKSLPAKTACQPPDPAYFSDLRPGQSVETTFEIRSARATSLTDIRYTADVSYLAASCAAHLRPRSKF